MPEQKTILNRDDVIKIWGRLQRRNNGNPGKDSLRLIAADFSVNKKTITRIANGELWRSVTRELMAHEAEVIEEFTNRNIPALPSTPDAEADFDSWLVGVRNAWHLSFDHPIHWGYYDDWDGKHAIGTDGIIIWDDCRLAEYAVRITKNETESGRLLASTMHELDTFVLAEIMTKPVGQEYRCGARLPEGVTSLYLTEADVNPIYIQTKFVKLAEANKCKLNMAGNEIHFVYLTQTPGPKSDPVVLAAIAVMENTNADLPTEPRG